MIAVLAIKFGKNYSTRYSRVVPHHSTDRAITSLTSQIGRDAVCSGVYGRSCGAWTLRRFIRIEYLQIATWACDSTAILQGERLFLIFWWKNSWFHTLGWKNPHFSKPNCFHKLYYFIFFTPPLATFSSSNNLVYVVLFMLVWTLRWSKVRSSLSQHELLSTSTYYTCSYLWHALVLTMSSATD